MSDATRPVYKQLSNYAVQETFVLARCTECPVQTMLEDVMVTHTRETSHRMDAEYAKNYSVRAQ